MVSSESPGLAPPSRKRPREKSTSSPPAAKRRKLAPIETLPGEILAPILYYSANIHLTQASPTILNALNGLYPKHSNRLYKNFSSSVFQDFCWRVSCHQKIYRDKMRLMNSKFFTWPLFLDIVRDIHSLYLNSRHLTRHYLQRHKSEKLEKHMSALNWQFRDPKHQDMMARLKENCKQASRFPEDIADGSMTTIFTSKLGRHLESLIWKCLDPSKATEVYEVLALLSMRETSDLFAGVPDKLLCRPFTQDKMAFLVAAFERRLDPGKSHLAAQGLLDAIEDDEQLAACLLMTAARIEDPRAMTVLRKAVVDDGCHSAMVSMIFHEIFRHANFCLNPYSRNSELDKRCRHPINWEQQDLLDPKLWDWAEQERKKGNWKGEWVEINLKRLNRDKKPVSAEKYCDMSEKELKLLKKGRWDEPYRKEHEEWMIESSRAQLDRYGR